MIIWITKYALTQGIHSRSAHVKDRANGNGQMAVCRAAMPAYMDEIFYEPDWHRTETAAKDHAETMRARKIASLQKQITKLEKLSFS